MGINISHIQASIRGDKPAGILNQDFIQIFESETIFIVSLSDGLGSSKHSAEGACNICSCVIDILQSINSMAKPKIISEEITTKWLNLIDQKHHSLKDYRTTNSFVAVFKEDKKILAGQLGDVMVSLRIDGLFRYIESSKKDFSNETNCLGSGRNEVYNIIRYDFGHSFDFLIATDGISDELQPEKIEVLHDYLKNKYQKIKSENRNNELQCELEKFINEKNNDDKSLVYAWTNKI